MVSLIRVEHRNGTTAVAVFDDGTRVLCMRGTSGLYYPRANTLEGEGPVDPTDPTDPPDPGGSAFKWPMNPNALNIRNGRPQDGYMTAQRPTHNGVDMSFPPFVNLMQYKSIADGVVQVAAYDPNSGGGHSVMVLHDNGWMSGYFHGAHTESASGGSYMVTEGQRITQGTPLMLAGSTGNSTGPHLHFVTADLRNGGVIWNRHIDPVQFMAMFNPNDEYLT